MDWVLRKSKIHIMADQLDDKMEELDRVFMKWSLLQEHSSSECQGSDFEDGSVSNFSLGGSSEISRARSFLQEFVK